jgi:aminoglycoside phosphotransferase (APT) family kinase protein
VGTSKAASLKYASTPGAPCASGPRVFAYRPAGAGYGAVLVDSEGLMPLAGGFSGETFVAESAGSRTVLRIYSRRGAGRGDAAVAIDAAVLRLVRGLLPVPEVLEVHRPDSAAGTPGVLVTSFLAGERLDVCWPDLGEEMQARVGRNLGVILGRLAQMPMVRAGKFVDAELRIEPWPEAPDVPAWVRHQRLGSALAEWPGDLYQGLCVVAATAQGLLERVGRACLVHSDFNAKNLLINRSDGTVTGLLDWEFAHAGVPGADLGNLLRFDRAPGLVVAVLDGYLEVAGHLDGLGGDAGRARLVDLARAADLVALVELAGRRGENPVADQADAQLRAVAAARDLHAQAEPPQPHR